MKDFHKDYLVYSAFPSEEFEIISKLKLYCLHNGSIDKKCSLEAAMTKSALIKDRNNSIY